VAQRTDLDHQADIDAIRHAEFDDAIENGLPVFVAGKVVIRDEEAVNAFSPILPDDQLDIVRRAPPRFLPLDIDDGAE
jgi:hypothetical protein